MLGDISSFNSLLGRPECAVLTRSGMSQTTNRCLPLIPDGRLHRCSASDNILGGTLYSCSIVYFPGSRLAHRYR